MFKYVFKLLTVIFIITGISACGGGGGGGDSSDPTATTYSIGGSVSGLTGSLVLQNNNGDSLTVSADGSFNFAADLNDAAAYSVSVLTQPTGQSCSISSGSGTVSGSNVTSVSVSCSASTGMTYTVGGTVSGLTDTLVLQNNSGDNLALSADGNFNFAAVLNDAASYSVSILTQPAGQSCSISSGSGVIGSADVTTVSVLCSDTGVSTYTIGGSVSGLTGTVVLQNNSGDDLTVIADGSFIFATAINDLATYSVSILTQPVGQSCSVSSGSGTVIGANVTSVSLSCNDVTYSVGGTVSGLVGNLILQNNSGDDLTVTANGSYFFATTLADGGSYDVSVASQPASYSCVVNNGIGAIGSASASNVDVTCSTRNIALDDLGLGVITNSPSSVVLLPIHARDKATGLSVEGLVTTDLVKDFVVKEDGTEVGVESFVNSRPVGDVDYTFRTVVVMDISSSISPDNLNLGKIAVKSLIDNLQDNQELAIYTFDDVVTLVHNFSNNQTSLSTVVDGISRGSASTNLYGAITTATGIMTDIFDIDLGVTYNTMILITDGDDTSGYLTKTDAQTAMQSRKVYALPVGDAADESSTLYSNLVDIVGEEQILLTPNWDGLNATLDTVRSNLLEYFKGLYYVYYASPSRTGTHTIDLSVAGNSNVALDGAVTGTFDATGFTSVVQKVVITGDTSVYAGESTTWSVETEWSNDLADYTWSSTVINDPSILEITTSNGGATGTIAAHGVGPGSDTISILDINWGRTASKTITVMASRAPGGFSVTNSDYQENTLSWTAVTDATGYKVYWDTTPGITKSSNQFAVTANSTTHTGLPSGSTYYYRVATLFGEQESGLSTEISATVVVPTVSNVSIISSPTQNDLSWSAVGTAEYRIYWNTTGSPTTADAYISVASEVTSYSHAGLDSATNYYYTVVAVDGGIISTPSTTTDTIFSVSGSVTGLVGSGFVLQNNSADNLSVTVDGTFIFPTEVADAYSVTILTQPVDQTCTVTNGADAATSDVSDITNVAVTCLNNYTIGGNVSGLTGTGLVLQNNSGDDLARSADGSFIFATTLPLSNTVYDVTILTQPVDQTCGVSNGSGTASSNITNVTITCLDHYSIGGTVSGLTGTGLALQNNAGDDLAISVDGIFTFPTLLPLTNTTYGVTILTQPVNQTCSVTNGSGTASSSVTNIAIECLDHYTVGGSVSGLIGTGLALQNNAGDDLAISANGSFTFSTLLPFTDTAYGVTILTQPVDQTCTVTNGSGTASSNVTDIAIECLDHYTVGGAVSGVLRTGLVLQNNAGDDLAISADGLFTFASKLAFTDTAYSVTILSQPADQTCSVTDGLGIATSDITSVVIDCVDDLYSIGGNVSGIINTGLVLQNNGGDNLSVSANGSFVFPTVLALSGNTTYDVTIFSQPSQQTCTVANGSGTASDDVTNISVTCLDDYFSIGGSVSDLTGTGLVIQNNGGDDLSISADGSFQFSTLLVRTVDASFDVTILTQPSGQTCTVSNGSGIATSDLSSVTVNCFVNTPQLAVTSTTKQLQFSWQPVFEAAYYKLMGNPDGVSGYTQVGANITSTNTVLDIGVHNIDWPNASYMLSACDITDVCQNSNVIFIAGEMLSSIAYFKASNTVADDYFGYAVSMSDDGSRLAVSATQESGGCAVGVNDAPGDCSLNALRGAVYVYSKSGSSWVQEAYIKANNYWISTNFGKSISLSGDGNTLAVGDIWEQSNSTGINGLQFSYDLTTGSMVNDVPNGTMSGAVYMFSRNIYGNWTQQAFIKASNAEPYDQFGYSVSLSNDGNTLAVGALEESSSATGVGGLQSDNTAASSGAAYIFTRSGSSWAQQAYVKASNTDPSDQFGYSVALSGDGNTLSVGSPYEDSIATGIDGDQADNSLDQAGAIYLFSRSFNVWTQQAYIKSSVGPVYWIGRVLALSDDGNTLATASTVNGGNSAYIFTRSGSTWSEQTYITAQNAESTDFFGNALSLSGDGNTLAVSSHLEDSNATGINGNEFSNTALKSGAVYIFERNSNIWSEKAYVKAPNTNAGDVFGGLSTHYLLDGGGTVGTPLSLSSDGSDLAIGAVLEDSSTTGVGGDQLDNSAVNSGAVYLY